MMDIHAERDQIQEELFQLIENHANIHGNGIPMASFRVLPPAGSGTGDGGGARRRGDRADPHVFERHERAPDPGIQMVRPGG